MSKGFLWFAQNNNLTDYARLSVELARSIKKNTKNNSICVVVDQKSIFKSEHVDKIIILKEDDSAGDQNKFANEHKAFYLSPFTHTIKIEADMLWTNNTDWWWHHLCQHDLVFAIHCMNYKGDIVKDSIYRRLFRINYLADIYSGMTYFRRSRKAEHFFKLCSLVMKNWGMVRESMLKNCHDQYPTTDVVYALAHRIMDPVNKNIVNFDWFKFIHSKPAINNIHFALDQYNYLNPVRLPDRIYLGGRRLDRIWHYHDKKTMEILDERIF